MHRMFAWFVHAAWCGVAVVTMAANGQAQGTPITVQLDWQPTAQFAGILVAKEQGMYAAEGLEVKILGADETTNGVGAVATHANWIGVAEADVLLAGIAKGEHVKAFATMMQRTPFALLTLRESGLTSIKSLKGKVIGLHDNGEKAIDVLLQFNGMTRPDVTIKSIPYSDEPLLNGSVSAMQGYEIDEAVRLEMEHHPVNVIPMSANGSVCYVEVLFAPDALLQANPDAAVRFVRATGLGWVYAAAHPEETATMIVKRYMPSASVAEQKASLLAVVPLLSAESPHFGEMRPATWEKSLQMFERYKLVDRKLSAGDAVDYGVLTRLYGK
jgi:ABC-type nitrate/sulfonate/bicarbonate transport system substrate-binding protein